MRKLTASSRRLETARTTLCSTQTGSLFWCCEQNLPGVARYWLRETRWPSRETVTPSRQMYVVQRLAREPINVTIIIDFGSNLHGIGYSTLSTLLGQGAGRYHLRSAGEYLRSGVFECANYSRGGSKEATLKKSTSKTRACAHRFSCTCKMKFKLL